MPGSTTFTPAPDTFTIQGAGGDIWGNSDSFHFYYGTWQDDFEIIARVVSQQNTNGWAKAGVMARATPTPDSTHLITAVTPGNGTHAQRRDSTGGGSGDDGLGGPNSGTGNLWVRLVGDYDAGTNTWNLQPYRGTLTGAAPGAWVPDPGPIRSPALGDPIQLGLAVTSHNTGATSTVVFDNVTVNGVPMPSPLAPPVIVAELSISSPMEPYLIGKAYAHDPGSGTVFGPVDWSIERGTPIITDGVLLSQWYLGNQTWSGTPAEFQIAQLSWSQDGAGAGYPPETPYTGDMGNYSVRVLGEIFAPVTREYNFAAYTDDYCRLTIDGTELVNDGNWTNWAGTANDQGDEGSITLQGGQWYTLEYLMTEGSGGDNARLLWDWDATTGQPLPAGSYLDVDSEFYRSVYMDWDTIATGTGNIGGPGVDGSFGIFLGEPETWNLRLNVTYTDPFVTVTGSDMAAFVGVPEPASLALLGLGLGVLARRRRRA